MVESFKYNLSLIFGNTLVAFEYLETVVIGIEAILNSRPLSSMSSNPNNLSPLTSAHFLIGGPLTSFHFNNTSPQRLLAWQHAQELRHQFWKRWHKEYLHQLITRNK